MTKRALFVLAKALLSVGLIIVLLLRIDLQEFSSLLGQTSTVLLPIFLLLGVVNVCLSALKWRILLCAVNENHSLPKLSSIYLMGMFFNNFLPSVVGGDLIRAFLLKKKKLTYGETFASIFVERYTGILVLMVISTASIVLSLAVYQFAAPVFPTALVILLFAFFSLLIFHSAAFRIAKALAGKTWLALLVVKAQEFQKKVVLYKNHPWAVAKALLVSLPFYFVTILLTWLAAKMLNITLTPTAAITFVPIVLTISILPISLNGLGVAEGVYVICLSQAGIPETAAFSIALLIRANIILFGLAGGAFYLVQMARQGRQVSRP